jgi:23S rRNA pseudouridine955/2504/2580 synthase
MIYKPKLKSRIVLFAQVGFTEKRVSCYYPSMVNTLVNMPDNQSKVQWLEITEDMAGQRIDNFLLARLKGAPKSLIYRILRKGEVRVNKGRIKPEYKLKATDIVRIPPIRLSGPKTSHGPGEKLSQLLIESVVYEDDAIYILNKPSGLAVHGGSGVNLGLIESFRHIKGDQSLELIHRLDRGTSGCVMIAKNRKGLLHMQQHLRNNTIDKSYQALVYGRWPNRKKHVSVPLLKNQLASGERIVKPVESDTPGAKESHTEFSVLARYQHYTLISAKPITGRTHQIRVHCQYAGHAILGDDKYASREQLALAREIGLKRLFLHAYRLVFKDADNNMVSVEAPLGSELTALLQTLSGC